MSNDVRGRQQQEAWQAAREYTPEKLAAARLILEEVNQGRDVLQAIQAHPLPQGGHVAKHVLVAVYHRLVESGEWQPDGALLARLRMKPTRSLSGVTTVTVLTKPFPCPGNCIFCPDDARMPKSYLADEPAAARAYQNDFDPYQQVRSRLESLEAVGHPLDKIELLILGGCWTAYPRDYQEWFVRRCFDALNGIDSATLDEAQRTNEIALQRNVGLVVETRPDEINPPELAWLRQLGITKVQMGAQSLDDRILALIQRRHTVADTLKACALLRAAGFKIVLHWMPNLLGATLESDHTDFTRLWMEAGCCPDEIKIYPTSLLENTALYAIWQQGNYHPYTSQELVNLLADLKPGIPEYCRVNRVIRDIPSVHVVEGNKITSLRQEVLAEVARRGQACHCIRCREVRAESVDPKTLELEDLVYHPAYAEEHFLSFIAPSKEKDGAVIHDAAPSRLAGYLRLSLPASLPDGLQINFPDLKNAAIVREVHVYGQALPVGGVQEGAAQHIGLGTSLLQEAEGIARNRGFQRLAVIAAVGTRRYYASRGFEQGELYMVKELTPAR